MAGAHLDCVFHAGREDRIARICEADAEHLEAVCQSLHAALAPQVPDLHAAAPVTTGRRPGTPSNRSFVGAVCEQQVERREQQKHSGGGVSGAAR